MFVYVMQNASMPGLLKVGYSSDPAARAQQLSASVAVPLPFEVVHQVPLLHEQYAPKAEALAHLMLDRYRVNDAREFFRVGDDNIAVQAIIISAFVVSRPFVLPSEWGLLTEELSNWPLTLAGHTP